MKIAHNVIELIVAGECPVVDPVGTNHADALEQAREILMNYEHDKLVPVLVALITRMQEQDKSIEMFEYTQKWRKRRP